MTVTVSDIYIMVSHLVKENISS